MNTLEAIASLVPEAREIRRDLHRHPELAGREVRTASVVARYLRTWGVDEVHENVGGTGVVGVLRGSGSTAASVALRADMDALPIQEASGVSHASVVANVMHACGHDGHTAILLTVARHLARSRDFAGTIYFIFQPAEENVQGAKALLADGLFERFPADRTYGLHNWPSLPSGVVGMRPGAAMAARDDFWIELEGRSAHGAYPHEAVDPVAAAAQVISAMQCIVSRNVAPWESAVVTVNSMRAGEPATPDRPTPSVTIPQYCQSAS